jgi:hypothetical protein
MPKANLVSRTITIPPQRPRGLAHFNEEARYPGPFSSFCQAQYMAQLIVTGKMIASCLILDQDPVQAGHRIDNQAGQKLLSASNTSTITITLNSACLHLNKRSAVYAFILATLNKLSGSRKCVCTSLGNYCR